MSAEPVADYGRGLIHKANFGREPAPVSVRARRILSVGLDAQGWPACWYVTGDEEWGVAVLPTGVPPPIEGAEYVGTFVVGRLVLHAWARRLGPEA